MPDEKKAQKNFSEQQKNIALILSGLTVLLLLGVAWKIHSSKDEEGLAWKKQYEQLHQKYTREMNRGEQEIVRLQQSLESGEMQGKEKEKELAALKQREQEMQTTVEDYRSTIEEMTAHFKEKRKKWGEAVALEEAPAVIPDVPTRLYRVERGDTLTRISSKLYGTPDRWKEIYDFNKDRIPSADSIREGTQLIVPEK